jgi:hypothetical protein
MGANFLLYRIPACKETKYRKKKLRALARKYTPSLHGHYRMDVFPLDTFRKQLLTALEDYWCFPESREIFLDTIDGVKLHTTGGMSWGDAPTEAAEVITILEECDEIIACLQRWAEADAKERTVYTHETYLEELIERTAAISAARQS